MTIRVSKNMNHCGQRAIPTHRLLLYCISTLLVFALIQTSGQQALMGQWQMLSHEIISIQGDLTPKGHILSPSYPSSVAVGEISLATLHAADNSSLDAILLSFEEMNLQTANNCEGEALNIFIIDRGDYAIDPSKLVHSFCGSIKLEPVLLLGRNLVIQFVNDEFVPGDRSRFKIAFEFLNASEALFNECERPNQFKCRNRKCISNELLCNGFDDCGDASDEDRWTPCHEVPSIPYKIDYKCGAASFGNSLANNREAKQLQDGNTGNSLMNRIIGGAGARVERRSLPHVSIQLIGIEPMSHICSGSLIHPMFVLTSAHCFKDEMSATSHRLLFGLQDLRHPDESQVQVRYAIHISFYPNFAYKAPGTDLNDLERANNLAIIELNAPVHMSPHVWPACLPHLGETIAAGHECVFTGFGETRGSGLSFMLKQLKQSIVHSSECLSMFSDFKVDDFSMICVRNKNFSGPCKGDSGGPLLCRNDDDNLQLPVNISEPESGLHDGARPNEPGDIIEFLTFNNEDEDNEEVSNVKSSRRRRQQSRYTVHGVTSFTTDGNFGGGYCGFEQSPTIYARVSNRIEWILTVLKLALPRLNNDDNLQDRNNKPNMFGYMFRSGYSQHENYTRPMTVRAQG